MHLDRNRCKSIDHALQNYKETVLEHNLSILHVLAEATGQFSGQDSELHMQMFVDKYLAADLTDLTSEPRGLLNPDICEELTRRCRLDGVAESPIDGEKRSEWFDTIREAIRDQNIPNERSPQPDLPPDIEYLCTLVRGIVGPGLPYHRERQQFDFISDIAMESPQVTKQRVIVPLRLEKADMSEPTNDLTFVWEDWDIAVAFKIGDGPRAWGGSYALFCRKGADSEWSWRYGVHDEEWCSEVYGTVEEFLGFYAHFREQKEEDVREESQLIDSTPRHAAGLP